MGITIQVGYGSIPNAIISNLADKKHLGVHTELLSDGIVDLMKKGVIDNTKKNVNRGSPWLPLPWENRRPTSTSMTTPPLSSGRSITRTTAGDRATQHMTAINSALEIDLTGQSTQSRSGRSLQRYRGQARFHEGSGPGAGGAAILAIQSTAENETVSRIVPALKRGGRGHPSQGRHSLCCFGIWHCLPPREEYPGRAHGTHSRLPTPKFKPWLIERRRKGASSTRTRPSFAGKGGEYPEELEAHRTTKKGVADSCSGR